MPGWISGPPRAAPARAPSRCRTPRDRRASGRAPAPGRRRRACSRPEVVTLPSLRLAYDDMLVRERRDLRQVRDDEDLGRLRQRGQPLPDLHRRLAADARVDLVEDERRHRPGVGQRDLDREHHPGELAPGRTLVRALAARSPVLAASSSSTSSTPVVVNRHRPPSISRPSSSSTRPSRTTNRACGIDSECSSSVTVEDSRSPASARSAGELGGVSGERARGAPPARRAAPRSARRTRRG